VKWGKPDEFEVWKWAGMHVSPVNGGRGESIGISRMADGCSRSARDGVIRSHKEDGRRNESESTVDREYGLMQDTKVTHLVTGSITVIRTTKSGDTQSIMFNRIPILPDFM
jgi:hypothetical protein